MAPSTLPKVGREWRNQSINGKPLKCFVADSMRLIILLLGILFSISFVTVMIHIAVFIQDVSLAPFNLHPATTSRA